MQVKLKIGFIALVFLYCTNINYAQDGDGKHYIQEFNDSYSRYQLNPSDKDAYNKAINSYRSLEVLYQKNPSFIPPDVTKKYKELTVPPKPPASNGSISILVNETLVEALERKNEEIESLKQALYEANKAKLDAESANLSEQSDFKQHALELRAEGKIEEAINSVDTDAADEEAAKRHIFKAELFIDDFQFPQAERHYLQAATIYPSYDNNRAIAEFYYNLNKFHEALAYYQKCLTHAATPQERAGVLNDMGNAQYKNNAYPEAEASYQEALKIHKGLAEKNPDAYLPNVATTLNNLGNLQSDQKEYSKAEASYREALKIRRELAKKNPDAYLLGVAMTLNNMGGLLWNKKEYPQAEASYREALETYKEIAEKNPDAYRPYVAMTLNNLGVLQEMNNKYPQAEVIYQEALETYKELAEKNPDAYRPYVATILNNIGGLQQNQKEYPAAEASYQEALKTWRELAKKNPDAYLPDVAMTLVNLSIFYQDYFPNKELSLQYANETIKIVGKCNPTPDVEKYRGLANLVIEDWKK